MTHDWARKSRRSRLHDEPNPVVIAVQTMTESLRLALSDQAPLEMETTIQVAMMQAAGHARPKIIEALAIDLREYMMCCYRIRAICNEWLR
jgi:hypothetical protein